MVMTENVLIVAGVILITLLVIMFVKGVLKLVLPLVVIAAVLYFAGPQLGWFEEEDVRGTVKSMRENAEKELDRGNERLKEGVEKGKETVRKKVDEVSDSAEDAADTVKKRMESNK
ncbi:MAG: hypothetical protein ACQEQV_09230 [Fibrobacterota bacterium]